MSVLNDWLYPQIQGIPDLSFPADNLRHIIEHQQ